MLVMIMSLLWVVFQIPSVQTYAAKKVASYLSKELNVPIEVESVEIDFLDWVRLRNLYIQDLNEDTLLLLPQLNVQVEDFNLGNKRLGISVQLERPIAKSYIKEGDIVYNHQFLVDYFSSDQSADSTSNWQVKLTSINVVNGSYSFNDYNKKPIDKGVDYFHIGAKKINLLAQQFQFREDTIVFKLNRLSLKEQSGFTLEKLASNSKIHGGTIQLDELEIKTLKSDIKGSYSMISDSFTNYSDYIKKVTMVGELEGSILAVEDLSYFVDNLYGSENQIYLEGDFNGTVDHLQSEDFKIVVDNKTKVEGDISFKGLPEIETTLIKTEISNFTTTAAALRKIPIPPFDEKGTLKIPEVVDELGEINFVGNFNGKISDFVANGILSTDLGAVKANLKIDENTKQQFVYKGNVSTKSFKIGQFLKNEDLGDVALALNINGKGLTKQDAEFEAAGLIDYFDFNGYRYRKVELNGGFKQQDFIGTVGINDPNLLALFKGEIDLNRKKTISKFTLDVSKANLAQLNLFNKKDSSTSITFQSKIDLVGGNIDDISGSAELFNIIYQDKKLYHKADQLQLSAQQNEEGRKVEINSSFLNAKIEGNYQLRYFNELTENTWHRFIPDSLFKMHKIPNQNFIFTADFINFAPISEILLPELKIDSGVSIQLIQNGEMEKLKASTSGSAIEYKNYAVNNFNVATELIRDSLIVEIVAETVSLPNIEPIEKFRLNSQIQQFTSNTRVKSDNWGDKVREIDLNIVNTFTGLNEMSFSFENSTGIVNDSLWKIENNNTIQLDSGTIVIEQLAVTHAKQQLLVNGVASSNKSDTLSIDLRSIDLAFISSLLPENTVNMEGTANGSTEIVGVFATNSFTTDLELEELVVNEVEVGQCNLSSIFDATDNSLKLNGNLGDKSSNLLKVSGSLYPLKEENNLDLKLKFTEFPLQLIKPYLVDYITNLEGALNGEVAVSGAIKTPELKGVLGLKKTSFNVNYLNTAYTINDKIVIEPDYIGFNLIKVKDENGKPAIATGTIFHENYSNFNYDIGLEFTNFLCLNTSSKDNELFYGKGVASGTANISGYGSQIILDLDLKTEKGTDFKIPLTEGVDVSEVDFLVFTNSPNYDKEEEKQIDLSGIDLNFDLEITPEAKLQIIFDEQVGDIIKAQGQGDLSMIINSIGDFNMYGQYLVEKGDYLFTLQNIINKRFEIAPNSSINWNGDPYQAVLNMTAIYNLRAPLFDLFPTDSSDEYKRRTPVELKLNMSENLVTPNINFDIQLPEATEEARRRLESVLFVNSNTVNPQEMNQQVFGLLVLNRFLPSSGTPDAASSGYNAGSQGLNNGYEFVSNQLSNWASKLSDQFDFGVKYQPADELNTDQFDVSVSSQFFKDKLIVDGNFGYAADNPDFQNQNSGFIGEFTAIYKLGNDGRYRVKAFNRSVANSLLQLNSPYTQGIGFFYRREFDTINELFWKKK